MADHAAASPEGDPPDVAPALLGRFVVLSTEDEDGMAPVRLVCSKHSPPTAPERIIPAWVRSTAWLVRTPKVDRDLVLCARL
jgi:hypothetical protein